MPSCQPHRPTGGWHRGGLPLGLAELYTPPSRDRAAPRRRSPHPLMPERVADLLVRLRWAIVAVWVVVGAVAVVRAPRTPELLTLRGGVVPETEAATADRSVSTRFRRPFNEFFVVALEGPASFVEGPPRAALDSITDLLRRERYVRTLISYHGSGDSLLLSRDGRLTFFIASVDAPRSDSAGRLVVAFRKTLRRALDRVPYRDAYR